MDLRATPSGEWLCAYSTEGTDWCAWRTDLWIRPRAQQQCVVGIRTPANLKASGDGYSKIAISIFQAPIVSVACTRSHRLLEYNQCFVPNYKLVKALDCGLHRKTDYSPPRCSLELLVEPCCQNALLPSQTRFNSRKNNKINPACHWNCYNSYCCGATYKSGGDLNTSRRHSLIGCSQWLKRYSHWKL